MKERHPKSNCILCHHTKLKLLESINCSDLEELYQNSFGFSIKEELKGATEINYYNCANCGLNFFDPNFAGSGVFYENLQNYRKVYYNPNRDEFTYAKSLLESSDSVLEIGSGSGFFASKIPNNKYLGLEYNDKAIEDALKKGIRLLKQSIESFSENTTDNFDIVCSFHVLEHVDDPYNFLKSSVKVLKENGKLIISVPFNASRLTSNINHVLNLPPHHITRWDLKTLKYIGKLFDLELVDYKVHNVKNEISKKDYFKVIFLDKLINIFYNKKVLIKPNIYNKLNKYNNFFIRKTKLYLFQKENKMLGENITIVFKKVI